MTVVAKKFVLTSALLACILLNGSFSAVAQQSENESSDDTNLEFVEEYDDDQSEETSKDQQEEQEYQSPFDQRSIREIIVSGNKQIPTQAILYRIPYRTGDIFDPLKTRDVIKRLYKDLKRLRSISIYGKPINQDQMDLYIVVEEKKVLKDYQFVGNTQVSNKEILDKIPFGDIPAIDPEELKVIVKKIKKIYAQKGFHKVDIDANVALDEQDTALVTFNFHEYPKSVIKRIEFTGNECISGKKLRSILFSREDWILSFLDNAGNYAPEMVDGDRHMIEQFYNNQGYLNAKVTDVETHFDECNNVTLIFDIQEGQQYTVSEVTVDDGDGLPGEQLAACIPLQAGQLYSRENVVDSIKALEQIWGSRGYLFASVEPHIMPNEADNTVSISFSHDLGDRVFLNKLTIIGNQKTRDKIIRRQLLLEEGDLITDNAMEASKSRVEALGYFEMRDGVNWKIRRINENLADLDLIIKEAKTGHASMQLGYGGTASMESPADALSAEVSISDNNLLGLGLSINASGRFAKNEKTFIANITQPWLFDRPIMAAFDVYHKRIGYEEFRMTNAITEQRTGGAFTTGFVAMLPRFYFSDIFVRANFGLDSIKYDGFNVGQGQIEDNPLFDVTNANQQYTALLQKLFTPGYSGFVSFTIGQEKKNHPMHPTRGYSWVARTFTGLPTLGTRIAFEKLDFDFHWYTPLIGEYDLIFHWHNYLGFAFPIKKQTIPYGELFHIGGPASVRGYLFGNISPRFVVGGQSDSIGASKALFVNAELIVPIRPDMSMKGVFFYDGGAGWDNPYVNGTNQQFIIHNNFDYRHSVGAGIRLLNPMPIKIDVGFKLDPRKNEAPYEVHFGMNYDW